MKKKLKLSSVIGYLALIWLIMSFVVLPMGIIKANVPIFALGISFLALSAILLPVWLGLSAKEDDEEVNR